MQLLNKEGNVVTDFVGGSDPDGDGISDVLSFVFEIVPESGPSVEVTDYTATGGAGDTVTLVGKKLRDIAQVKVVTPKDRFFTYDAASGKWVPTDNPAVSEWMGEVRERTEKWLHGRVIEFTMPDWDNLNPGVAYFDVQILLYNKKGEQVDIQCNEAVPCDNPDASTRKSLPFVYSVASRKVIHDIVDVYGIFEKLVGDSVIPGTPPIVNLRHLLQKAIERISAIDHRSISLDEAKEIAQALANSLGISDFPQIEGPSLDVDLIALLQKMIERISTISQGSLSLNEVKELANGLAESVGLHDLPELGNPGFDIVDLQSLLQKIIERISESIGERRSLEEIGQLANALAQSLGIEDLPTFEAPSVQWPDLETLLQNAIERVTEMSNDSISLSEAKEIAAKLADALGLHNLPDLEEPSFDFPDLTSLLENAIEKISAIDARSVSLDEIQEIAKELAKTLNLGDLPELEGPTFDLPELTSLLEKAIEKVRESASTSIPLDEAKEIASEIADSLNILDLPELTPLTPADVVGKYAGILTESLFNSGLPIASGLNEATAVAVDPITGDIWVSVSSGVIGYQDLLRIDQRSGKTTFLLSLRGVDNLDFDLEGNLFISADNCIKKASIADDDDLTLSDVICLSNGSSVHGIGITPSQEILFATSNKGIYGIDSNGNTRTLVENLSSAPLDLTVDPTGRVFFTTDGAPTLMELLSDGSTQMILEGNDIYSPHAVGLDFNGGLLVDDFLSGDSCRIVTTEGALWQEGFDLIKRGGISSDLSGQYVAILDQGTESVYRFTSLD